MIERKERDKASVHFNIKHGMSHTRIYQVWADMRRRCLQRDCVKYSDYGGRGIRICKRWASFKLFLADMGNPPKGWTIDRLDNNGHYTPKNCVWATAKHQIRNTRVNRLLSFDGKTLCLSAWAEKIGIAADTLYHRLKEGWAVERALTEPLHPNGWRVR